VHNIFKRILAVPWLWDLVSSLSPWRPWFSHRCRICSGQSGIWCRSVSKRWFSRASSTIDSYLCFVTEWCSRHIL